MLGLGVSPGKGNGNPYSILAWEIPWTEEPGALQSLGSQRVRHNWATKRSTTHSLRRGFSTSKVKTHCCYAHVRESRFPWTLLEHYLLEKGHTSQAPVAQGGSISAGRQIGIQFQQNCPEHPPRSNLEDCLWKSSVHTEIIHICGYLLTWICCADPPSIHFTRISLESLWLPFLTSLMGNSSVPRSEWMPSVDVGNRASGHEKKIT